MTPASIGLGCMRLSTAADRDEDRGIAVIHAALNAGATLIDTADAYCHDERDTGHNERLIARALATWTGDRNHLTVATKGGIVRTGGAWINNAKAKHLRAACDASRTALGVDTIDLYQLHAVDPATPLETSVRTLAALQKEGAIRKIGLCNVTVSQLEAARAIASIEAVQVSLSVLDDENLRNGLAEYCREHGILLIAYRPLGGGKVGRLARLAPLAEIAECHGASPQEVALAWLSSFGDGVIPIPGPTRPETAHSIGRARRVVLTEEDRARLDENFSGRLLRIRRADRRPKGQPRADVVIVMGMPGAGKTTWTRRLQADGYVRLNRDELGGSLRDLVPLLDQSLAQGTRRIVLDNTYASRASRNDVIECAWQRGATVRCVHIAADLGQAQINAIFRMLDANEGRLPSPEDIRRLGKIDPRFLAPTALFSYERTLELPTVEEGFEAVDRELPVVAHAEPATPQSRGAIVLDPAAALASADQVAQLRQSGWLVFGCGWRTPADVMTRAAEILDGVSECPHPPGPPVCWCRRPIPGLVVEFARRRTIPFDRIVVIGTSAADGTMAKRLGATLYQSLNDMVSSG